ncbi:MAG: hypothetical protein ACOC6J_12150 [Spirochaetota bacterium]
MWHFDEHTIRLLVNVVSPDASEPGRIIRSAARDARLLSSILQDRRLHSWLLERPHEMIAVAPHAFFAALLYRVRRDLATHAFTHERDSGRMVVVFDIKDVRHLLDDDAVIAYLSWVLASFVHIHSVTRSVRVRRSVWRKYTVSDYDVHSLLGYVGRIEPERRPIVYRRIGEVALFQSGVFADSSSVRELYELGPDSYRKALEGGAVASDEAEAVDAVRELFLAATKAYAFMTDHYLGALRTKVFAPGA